MKRLHLLLVLVLALASVQLAACSPQQEVAPEQAPVHVEHLNGAQPTRVTLTPDAVKRLDLQTDSVQVATVNGAEKTLIPYSSIVYDTEGKTWVYTSPQVGTYLRTPVQVESIDGDDVAIAAGLPAGTMVVTVGAEELFGSETEFEEE
jgi:hypothetical protein